MNEENLNASPLLDPAAVTEPPPVIAEEPPQDPPRGTIAEWTVTIVLLLFATTSLVQAFVIPSASMENTLLIGDRVLVSKLTPGPFDLHRGDVVVFSDPGDWLDLPPRTPEGDG